jgi:hypothetical protein
MTRSIKPTTSAFLIVLMMTGLVWILRGLGVLTFIPGWILWGLILLCVLMAVIGAVR